MTNTTPLEKWQSPFNVERPKHDRALVCAHFKGHELTPRSGSFRSDAHLCQSVMARMVAKIMASYEIKYASVEAMGIAALWFPKRSL